MTMSRIGDQPPRQPAVRVWVRLIRFGGGPQAEGGTYRPWWRGLLNARAFTMMEIMVAVVILGVGLVLVYESLLKSMDAYQLFEARIEAHMVADEVMTALEREIRSPWQRTIPLRQQGARQALTRVFSWKAHITPRSTAMDLYEVAVNVTWPEGNRMRQIERVTLLSAPFSPEEHAR